MREDNSLARLILDINELARQSDILDRHTLSFATTSRDVRQTSEVLRQTNKDSLLRSYDRLSDKQPSEA